MALTQRFLIFLVLPVVSVYCGCCQGPHESYTGHGPACIGDGCHPIIHKRECDRTYQTGCFCDCGYFRNFDGVCVPAEECSGGVSNVEYSRTCPGPNKCGGLNEHYTKSNFCVDQCPLTNGSVCNDLLDSSGCYCLPDFKRNTDGVCIDEDECPMEDECAGQNEHYTESSTCEEKCPDGSVCNDEWIDIGCFCLPGFKRNQVGVCVPENECSLPECTRPHEHFTVGNFCEDQCPPTDGSVCNALLNSPGCYCRSGFKRNSEGRCVRLTFCLTD